MNNKISINNDIKNSHTFLLFSIIVLLVAMFFAAFYNQSNYILLIVVAVWLPSIFNSHNPLTSIERTFVYVSFLFLSIVIFYNIIGVSSLSRGFLLRDVGWLMSGVISVYVLKIFNNKELSIVFYVFTILLLILLVVYVRMGNELLSVEDDSSLITNAWNSSMYMLVSGLCLIAMLNIKAIFPKIISFFLLLLTLYLNFMVLQRATNIFFTILELALILIFNLRNKYVIALLVAFSVVSSILLFNANLLVDVLDRFGSVMSDRVVKRVETISFLLEYEDVSAAGGSIEARNNLMMRSWDTFTSSFPSFVFGVGAHRGTYDKIGNHSFFLDTLASYGIIGGALMFLYFKNQFKIMVCRLNRLSERVLYMQIVVVFAMYILRNFYGVLAVANVNYILLIYIPLFCNYIANINSKHRALIVSERKF